MPRTQICKVLEGCRWGGMLSIRESIMGRYVIIPRTQICIVVEGCKVGRYA